MLRHDGEYARGYAVANAVLDRFQAGEDRQDDDGGGDGGNVEPTTDGETDGGDSPQAGRRGEPLTTSPLRRIVTAPRTSMPDTTCAAMREGSSTTCLPSTSENPQAKQ